MQGGEWQRAQALFEEMQQAPPEESIAPNQFTYNALISVFTYSGRLDLATEKFREMADVRVGRVHGGRGEDGRGRRFAKKL